LGWDEPNSATKRAKMPPILKWLLGGETREDIFQIFLFYGGIFNCNSSPV